jgi:hypothetical protein
MSAGDIIGDKALIRRLKHMTNSAERAVRKQGLNAGSRVVEKAAKAMAPVGTGALKVSLGHVVRSSGKRLAYAVIGPVAGKGVRYMSGKKKLKVKKGDPEPQGKGIRKINPARYGHLPEEGFRHLGGFVAGQFFLKRALEMSAPLVTMRIGQTVKAAIEKRGF